MIEEIVPHERVVAFGVLAGDVDVFVHIESYDVGEADFAGLVEFDKLFVHSERR